MENTFRFKKKLVLFKKLLYFKFEIYNLEEIEVQAESESDSYQLEMFEKVVNRDQIGRQGKYQGWTEITTKAIGMRSFIKNDVRINIWRDKFGTYTVSTALKHPKRETGTQLYRREVTIDGINDLFINPRKHTGKGYYTK